MQDPRVTCPDAFEHVSIALRRTDKIVSWTSCTHLSISRLASRVGILHGKLSGMVPGMSGAYGIRRRSANRRERRFQPNPLLVANSKSYFTTSRTAGADSIGSSRTGNLRFSRSWTFSALLSIGGWCQTTILYFPGEGRSEERRV